MKFPSFKKSTRSQVPDRKAQDVEKAAPVSVITWLRKTPFLYSKHLPDAIRIPAMGAARPDEVVRLLPDATIDDLAFAIQASEEESSEVLRRTGALKELYEAARKRGALGTTTIAEAFAAAIDEEVRK
jgi:hypothetical protein